MYILFKNKKLTLGAIFLMLLVLAVQLVNILSEEAETENDKFEITGAYFVLETTNVDSLKQFYFEYLNFYPLELKGEFIANDAVRIKIRKVDHVRPQKIIIRTKRLSRLFRKLIEKKIKFIEPKHLDENDFLTFTIKDVAGNTLVFVEE